MARKSAPLFSEPYEAWEQEQVFLWAFHMEPRHPVLALMQGSINGVRIRDWGALAKMKKQGLKKGFPDISLPVPRHGYNGLFIELKRVKTGTVSSEQKKILAMLNDEGNYAIVCKGHNEAIDVLEWYIGVKG